MPLRPYSRGELLVEAPARSQREVSFAHVERNLPKLRELIEQMQDDAYRLAQIRQRARSLLLKHG